MPPKIIIYGFSASNYLYTIKIMKAYYSNINNFKESTQGMKDSAFEDRYASYLDRISQERRNHLLSFKNEDDRLRSLAASILLTEIIETNKEYIGISECSFPIVFKHQDAGKPYIADVPYLKFSISHSGSYAAVGIALSQECKDIGIDIQAKDRKSVLNIADRFYTDTENNIIQSGKSDLEKDNLFYEIWAAKEAFIKCNGKGLSYGISNFNADINKDVITDLDGNVIAKLKKQACPEGYACYICYI